MEPKQVRTVTCRRPRGRPRRAMHVAFLGLALLALPLVARAAETARPTRELLKLIPADAGVVLTLDDLRGHTRELLSSRLAGEFLKLPAVKAWFDGEKYRELETARETIEQILKVSPADIRDKVLGDAVVLALSFPDGEPFDPAKFRGVLLLKAAEPALLERMIGHFNALQKQNGQIAEVVERVSGKTHYYLRTYPAESGRQADAYVLFPDGTFAISNASGLIADVIGRRTGWGRGTSLSPNSFADLPRFRDVDRRLPDQAVARLFVDPRVLSRILSASPQPATEDDRQGLAIVQGLIASMNFAGVGLVASGGRIALHAVETFDSREFERLFGAVAEPAGSADLPLRVPSSALAVASLRLDLRTAYQHLVRWVPEADRPRLANIETVVSGIFLGQDLRTHVLPALGPGVLGLIDAPRDEDLAAGTGEAALGAWPFPTVLSVEMASDPARASIAHAAENAMRTFLAALCLDEQRAEGLSRIASRDVAGVAVLTLEPPIPFACAVDARGHRLVLGTSADAVASFLARADDPAAGDRFRRLRSRAFPEAQTFLCLDLTAAAKVTEKHRPRLAKWIATRDNRPVADVSRDLDQVIGLAQLFEAFFITSRFDAGDHTGQQTLGLLAREAAPSGPQP